MWLRAVMDSNMVLDWLEQRMQQLCVTSVNGSVSQKQVDWFVAKGCKKIERLCKNVEVRYADVVWGGLAMLIGKGKVVESFGRRRSGGLLLTEWKNAAIVAGGWQQRVVRSMEVGVFRQWKAEVLAAVARMPGAAQVGEAFVVPAGGLSNAFHRVKRMWQRSDGADLFHCCVAALALECKILGDVSRRFPGGKVNATWWEGKVEGLIEEGILPRSEGREVRAFLVAGCEQEVAVKHKPKQESASCSEQWWVVDFCCGSKSRCAAVREEMLENWNLEVKYIGIDVAPVFWDGSKHQVPEWVADVMDDDVFPRCGCVQAVSEKFGLRMEKLVHVFISTPCATNSRADMSNRNKGYGYRDWRQLECPPLPVSEEVDGVVPPGFTSQKHHDLAVLHDKLEQKLIVGVAVEAAQRRFSFSAENPRAGLARKTWMQIFQQAPLRTVEVHHCAYGGVYRKPTHYFTNLKVWEPAGWSGSGKCGGRGKKGTKRCRHGCVIEGRFKHFHTIARESVKEFSSAEVSRKMAKNALPAMQTKEIVGSAWRAVIKGSQEVNSRSKA